LLHSVRRLAARTGFFFFGWKAEKFCFLLSVEAWAIGATLVKAKTVRAKMATALRRSFIA
jgi:hypothetical protein